MPFQDATPGSEYTVILGARMDSEYLNQKDYVTITFQWATTGTFIQELRLSSGCTVTKACGLLLPFMFHELRRGTCSLTNGNDLHVWSKACILSHVSLVSSKITSIIMSNLYCLIYC